MQKRYLETGQIVSVHGIHGAVRVYPWCDDPEMLCNLETLYLGADCRPVKVLGGHTVKNMAVLRLEGITTVEEAQKLRGQVLYADREDLVLPEGAHFIADLIGLRVEDVDTGALYGEITDVTQTGANDVYTVRSPKGKTFLIPAVREIVPEIDLEKGRVLLKPIPGLLNEEDSYEAHD